MCKEAGVAYLVMLPTIMQGQTEENHQNSQCFKAQLIFKPATCRIPDRRFTAWNVLLGATDLKVPRANNANDIGLLITDIIVLIITRIMVHVCYVCVDSSAYEYGRSLADRRSGISRWLPCQNVSYTTGDAAWLPLTVILVWIIHKPHEQNRHGHNRSTEHLAVTVLPFSFKKCNLTYDTSWGTFLAEELATQSVNKKKSLSFTKPRDLLPWYLRLS